MTSNPIHLFQFQRGETDDTVLLDIAEVFDEGGNVFTTRDLYSAAENGSLVVAQARKTGEIVGAMTLRPWLATDSFELNQHLPEDQQVMTDPPALYLLDLAVRERWRQHSSHVGSLLVRTAMDHHAYDEKRLYTRIFATSRVPTDGSGPNSLHLLCRLGFEPIGVAIRNFYADCDDRLQCIRCDPYQNGVACSCSGIWMLWRRPQ
jgi:hypothetical protein